MRRPRIAVQFFLLLLVFLAMDAIWLTFAGQRLYRPAIGHLMHEGFSIGPAVLFYLLHALGLVFFATLPAARSRDALLRGALFGLIAYATYDLTNQATLRDWPWKVTVVDLAWGAIVSGISCAVAHRLTQRR